MASDCNKCRGEEADRLAVRDNRRIRNHEIASEMNTIDVHEWLKIQPRALSYLGILNLIVIGPSMSESRANIRLSDMSEVLNYTHAFSFSVMCILCVEYPTRAIRLPNRT